MLYGDYWDAHQRLGRKISYISLYKYCHIIDKQERQVAEQSQSLERSNDLIHKQTDLIAQIEQENIESKLFLTAYKN